MKQIQKCPHCHKDSVFSHNICPNCGFESKYEERGEPDYKLDENGKERHGRILLGVIMGLLGAPLLTWAATNVFLLTDENRTMEIPLFRVFLACVIVGWIFWTIWNNGYRWLTRGVMAVSFLGGFWMLGWAVKMIVQIVKKVFNGNVFLVIRRVSDPPVDHVAVVEASRFRRLGDFFLVDKLRDKLSDVYQPLKSRRNVIVSGAFFTEEFPCVRIKR